MIELLIYYVSAYFALGITAWLYIGYKDEFIDSRYPLIVEVLNTLQFFVEWYPIFIDLALDELQNTGQNQEELAENLEKALNEAGN